MKNTIFHSHVSLSTARWSPKGDNDIQTNRSQLRSNLKRLTSETKLTLMHSLINRRVNHQNEAKGASKTASQKAAGSRRCGTAGSGLTYCKALTYTFTSFNTVTGKCNQLHTLITYKERDCSFLAKGPQSPFPTRYPKLLITTCMTICQGWALTWEIEKQGQGKDGKMQSVSPSAKLMTFLSIRISYT